MLLGAQNDAGRGIMILYIDSTDFNKVTYALVDGKKVISKSFVVDPHKSHETLLKLDEFLKSAKIKPLTPALSRKGRGGGIAKIVVNKGPGSYTGVRVGVTHAMALGFAWGVPVKAVSKDKFVIS